eukprot:290963-Chlamydomonas_euryale.AAC.2
MTCVVRLLYSALCDYVCVVQLLYGARCDECGLVAARMKVDMSQRRALCMQRRALCMQRRA